jgi:23S rRNA (cytosine1962-C5)-methyltransferase
MPGLTVDVYAGVAVVVFDGGAAAAFWEPRLPHVLSGLAAGGLPIEATWIRGVRGVRGSGRLGPGGTDSANVPALIAIREGAARFDVDVRNGQKTGFFLDQRRNRSRVAELANGARVLNLFAYTGGFSVWAGLAGAAHVTSVDIAAPAVAAAIHHWRSNGLASNRHTGVAQDAFTFLERAAAANQQWDIVVVDPPSFAPSEAALAQAIPAYVRLNRLAHAVTKRGGILVSASCSSHLSETRLRAVLAEISPADRPVRVIEARGAAADHPTRPGFPEGKYLKVLLAVC